MKNKRIVSIFIMCICVLASVNYNLPNAYGEQGDYLIKINMIKNCITVYEKNSAGEYVMPVKSMACSTFENAITDEATYSIISMHEWNQMSDGTFSQYAIQFNWGIFICSTPYSAQSKDTLITDNFNGLGEAKSTQNIWVCTADAKWLTENCKAGNKVVLYNDESSDGPLGKPDTIKLNANTSKFVNWDPTDDVESNPWKGSTVKIEGVKDIEAYAGDEVDFLENIKGYDICGNDITKDIIIMGSYDLQKEGTYSITYYLKDATGAQENKSANLYIKKKAELETTTRPAVATPSEIDNVNEKSNMEKMKVLVVIGLVTFAITFFIIKYTKKD